MRGRHRARAIRPLLVLALVLAASVFSLQTLVQPAPKASAGSYTPAGNWWGVDSVDPVNAADLAAVRNWYQGGTPQVWGRYISDIGGALTKTEMNFASQNGIYLYLLVADRNNSSPLVCGRDLNASDAVTDAQTAVAAANALGIKPGAVLYKDFEQTQCPGEPSASYIQSWYQTVAASTYQVGFYGNAFNQNNQFPTAFCAAAGAVPGLVAHVSLSASEPEPNFNSAIGSTGPATAPTWAADTPSCAPAATTSVWQYGEVGSQVGNIADIDEVRPGAPGLVAPDGSITRSDSGSVPDRNLVSDGGFNGSAVGWNQFPGTNFAVYPSGIGGANAFEGSGYAATNASAPGGSIYQDIPTGITTGQTFCASVELATADPGTGGSGTFAIWLIGGAFGENSTRSVAGLPANSGWVQTQTCVAATGPHTEIRVQFYPAVNGPTIVLDDLSVTPDRAVNGGVNGPIGNWAQMPNTNMARYPSGAGGSYAYEGTGYLATNASASGGSIFQDIPTAAIAGDTFCATAELTSADRASGAGGLLAIWLLGGSGNENGTTSVSNLPGQGVWTLAKACVQATGTHTVIRIQFYPTVGAPTVGLDAISVL